MVSVFAYYSSAVQYLLLLLLWGCTVCVTNNSTTVGHTLSRFCHGFMLPLVHNDRRAYMTLQSGAQYGSVMADTAVPSTVRSRLRILAVCGSYLPLVTITTPPHTLIMVLSPVVHVCSSSAGAAARAAPCAP